MNQDPLIWRHVIEVTRPAMLLADPGFIDEIADRLHEVGIQAAVVRRDPAPLFDWLMGLVALQGISDERAFAWDAEHGGVRFADLDADLRARPSCRKLRSYWDFSGCRYRKGTQTCVEPSHLPGCPLTHDYKRNGTTTLFAALSVLEGKVIGRCVLRHRYQEFVLGLTRVGGHPEAFIRGVANAQDTPAVFA